jgi:hypothetical protein
MVISSWEKNERIYNILTIGFVEEFEDETNFPDPKLRRRLVDVFISVSLAVEDSEMLGSV